MAVPDTNVRKELKKMEEDINNAGSSSAQSNQISETAGSPHDDGSIWKPIVNDPEGLIFPDMSHLPADVAKAVRRLLRPSPKAYTSRNRLLKHVFLLDAIPDHTAKRTNFLLSGSPLLEYNEEELCLPEGMLDWLMGSKMNRFTERAYEHLGMWSEDGTAPADVETELALALVLLSGGLLHESAA